MRHATASASASRKAASASSTWAFVMTNGGIQRTVLSHGPQVRSIKRRLRQPLATALPRFWAGNRPGR